MQRLVDAIAQINKSEMSAIKEIINKLFSFSQEPGKVGVLFGLSKNFLRISDEFELNQGSDRITVSELARMRSLLEDIRERFLLPYTEGTDEMYDMANPGSSQPQYNIKDKGIVGGNRFITVQELSEELGNISPTLDNVTFGSTEPANPPNDHLWFQPNAIAPQPWTRDASSNNWRSPIIAVDFPAPSVITGSQSLSKKFQSGITKVWIESSSSQLRTVGSSGATSSNYYQLQLRIWNTSGVATNIVDFNNQNQALNTSRFNDSIHNIYITNPLYIEMIVTRLGAATGLSCTNTSLINVRWVL